MSDFEPAVAGYINNMSFNQNTNELRAQFANGVMYKYSELQIDETSTSLFEPEPSLVETG